MREVKRLDSISRSPVYSSIGEALAGLATIRAYRCEQRLSQRNAQLVDNSVIMSLVNMSMNRRAPPAAASERSVVWMRCLHFIASMCWQFQRHHACHGLHDRWPWC